MRVSSLPTRAKTSALGRSRILGRSRRGAAAFAVVAVIGLTTATSLLALSQVRTNLLIVNASARQVTTLGVANGCAEAAIKVLPQQLEAMMYAMSSGVDHRDELWSNQIDADLFENPFEGTDRQAFCVVEIAEIRDSAPTVGSSANDQRCFKMVNLRVSGYVTEYGDANAVASTEELLVRAELGPVTCQN